MISSWHGRRTMAASYFDRYGWHAVQKHVECLRRVRHGCDRITIVAPTGPEDTYPPDYEEYLWWLREVNGVPVRHIRRDNRGHSYEGWRLAYLDDPTFDYYIFIEDDYCPVHDDLAPILAWELDGRFAYLCGYMWRCTARDVKWAQMEPCDDGDVIDVASVSNGIVAASAMKAAAARGPFFNQVHFSQLLQFAGVEVVDWVGRYRSPFFCDNPKAPELKDFSPDSNEYVMVPIQMLVGECPLVQELERYRL